MTAPAPIIPAVSKPEEKTGKSEADIAAAAARRSHIKLVQENRRARHDFEIVEKIEAGIMLSGAEVKSLRAGHVQFEGAFARIDDKGEVWLNRLLIGRYRQASSYSFLDERRERKLLLKKAEIHRLHAKFETRGLTFVPLRVYFKGPWVKIELGIAKGKTKGDKRDTLKKREMTREAEMAIKNRR